MKGGWRRAAGAFYSHDGTLIRRGIERELREGESYCSGSVTGERNGWRREMTGSADRWGRVVSRRGRRERYRFRKGFLGCGLVSSSGPKGFPEALFLIFFSSFSFSIFLFLHIICKNA
jgi:hypothetical protein